MSCEIVSNVLAHRVGASSDANGGGFDLCWRCLDLDADGVKCATIHDALWVSAGRGELAGNAYSQASC